MKKLLCALLICALCAWGLAGCKKGTLTDSAETARSPSNANPEITAVPEEGGHGEEDQSAALADMPTLAPAVPVDGAAPGDDDDAEDDEGDGDYYSMDALINGTDDEGDVDDEGDPVIDAPQDPNQAPTPRPGGGVIDPNTLSYTALNDPDMKMTFNYPSNWVNVPGIYTVCYREQVEPGDFPARVAISAKRLVHSPEGTVLTDELTGFVRVIRKQYDANTFQLGTLNAEDTFMGKQAYSNTYLAYSGETEVKGFIIGQSVGRVLYVFHFCASYEDYTAMERVMRYMLNSVQIVQDENK